MGGRREGGREEREEGGREGGEGGGREGGPCSLWFDKVLSCWLKCS